ncbi:MAG: nucleotide exchange factor GrpE [Luteolibacter sp.]
MHTPNDTPSHEEKPEDSIQPDEAAAEQSAENTCDEALDPLQALENEATKWREISLRTAAEMDNLRKRTAREREEAIRYANQRLLEELLPVIDNFDMGMQAASQDTSSMIYIGMDMVRRQLGEFLSAQGVEEIGTDGEFDPNLHEAVAQEASPDGSDGRILRVTRKGYKLRERLLRPASVVVSQSSNESAAEGGKA